MVENFPWLKDHLTMAQQVAHQLDCCPTLKATEKAAD